MDEGINELHSSSLDFDSLYRTYATDVLRVAYYYLGDRHQAEDVTQDVFIRLMTSRPVLEEGHEKAWLLKVTLNRCRDLWRSGWFKKMVFGHPTLELFPAPDDIASLADASALADAINRLPPDFKEVVLLHYYQGFSVAEIGAMLNLAEGTVSSRLSRARKKLEKTMNGDDEP